MLRWLATVACCFVLVGCATTSGGASAQHRTDSESEGERRTISYEDSTVELPVDTRFLLRVRPSAVSGELRPFASPVRELLQSVEPTMYADSGWGEALLQLARLPAGGAVRLVPQLLLEMAENAPGRLVRAYGTGLVDEGNAVDATTLAPLDPNRPVLMAMSFARHRASIRDRRLGGPPSPTGDVPDWLRVRLVLPSSEPGALADALRTQCDALELPNFDPEAPPSRACGVVANVETRDDAVVADLFYSEQWQRTTGPLPELRPADHRGARRAPRIGETPAWERFRSDDGPIAVYARTNVPDLLAHVGRGGKVEAGPALSLSAPSTVREFEGLYLGASGSGDESASLEMIRSFTQHGRRVDRAGSRSVHLPAPRVSDSALASRSGWSPIRAQSRAKAPLWMRRLRETPPARRREPLTHRTFAFVTRSYWEATSPMSRLHAYLFHPSGLGRVAGSLGARQTWIGYWNDYRPVAWRAGLDHWSTRYDNPGTLVGGLQLRFAQGVPARVEDVATELVEGLDRPIIRSKSAGSRLAVEVGPERVSDDLWSTAVSERDDTSVDTYLTADLEALRTAAECEERLESTGEGSPKVSASDSADEEHRAQGWIRTFCRLSEGVGELALRSGSTDAARWTELGIGSEVTRSRPELPSSGEGPASNPDVPACYSRIVWTARQRRTRAGSGRSWLERVSEVVAPALATEIRRRRQGCEVDGRWSRALRRLESLWWHEAALFEMGRLDFSTVGAHLGRACGLGESRSCRWRDDLQGMRLPDVPVVHDVKSGAHPVPLTAPVLTPEALYIESRRLEPTSPEGGKEERPMLRRLVHRDRPYSLGGDIRESVTTRALLVHPSVAAGRIERMADRVRGASDLDSVALLVRRRGISASRDDRTGFLLDRQPGADSTPLRIHILSNGFRLSVDGEPLDSVESCSDGQATVCGRDNVRGLNRRLGEAADSRSEIDSAVVVADADEDFEVVARTLAAALYRTEEPYPNADTELDGEPTVEAELFPRVTFRTADRRSNER